MTVVAVPRWRFVFLRHLSLGHPVAVAARLTNVGMDKLLSERQLDEDFAREWADTVANAPRLTLSY